MAWMVIVRDSGLYPRFPQPFQSRPMPRVNSPPPPLSLAIKLAPRFLPALPVSFFSSSPPVHRHFSRVIAVRLLQVIGMLPTTTIKRTTIDRYPQRISPYERRSMRFVQRNRDEVYDFSLLPSPPPPLLSSPVILLPVGGKSLGKLSARSLFCAIISIYESEKS